MPAHQLSPFFGCHPRLLRGPAASSQLTDGGSHRLSCWKTAALRVPCPETAPPAPLPQALPGGRRLPSLRAELGPAAPPTTQASFSNCSPQTFCHQIGGCLLTLMVPPPRQPGKSLVGLAPSSHCPEAVVPPQSPSPPDRPAHLKSSAQMTQLRTGEGAARGRALRDRPRAGRPVTGCSASLPVTETHGRATTTAWGLGPTTWHYTEENRTW